MGRTKGYRVLKKVAEDFVGFKPPLTSTQLKKHPKSFEVFDRLTSPLPPLTYKLQEVPSELPITEPLGNTGHLPFFISRTHRGNLPVYSDYRNDRSRQLTIIRRLLGDVEAFKTELSKVVSNNEVSEKNGRVEVKGLHVDVVSTWLRRLGF
jgi:large subunit ribosomal protein L49